MYNYYSYVHTSFSNYNKILYQKFSRSTQTETWGEDCDQVKIFSLHRAVQKLCVLNPTIFSEFHKHSSSIFPLYYSYSYVRMNVSNNFKRIQRGCHYIHSYFSTLEERLPSKERLHHARSVSGSVSKRSSFFGELIISPRK